MVNNQSGKSLVSIFFNCIESRFRLLAKQAIFSKSETVLFDSCTKIIFRFMKLVSWYRCSNLVHISKQKSRLLIWDIGFKLKIDLINFQRELVIVSYFISLVLQVSLVFSSSFFLFRRERVLGFVIWPSIYCHNFFILQEA